MKTPDLFNESNEATYCPEDDKIRLYVGRVPRDEYLALRSEGWTSTPKQDCDFVAVWRPGREDTALAYAGYIGDEDQGPEDRAADRAERFSMYREKRTAEAHDHADTFDTGPTVHGFQNQGKADRAAKRHNRTRDNALTQWSKAEYWQTRTAGVISNALYKSSASVRRGRVLKLEAEQRKHLKSWTDHAKEQQHEHDQYNAITGNGKLKLTPYWSSGLQYHEIEPAGAEGKYTIEQARLAVAFALCESYSDTEKALKSGELLPVDFANNWLAVHPERPADHAPSSNRWHNQYNLRIAYENQMLESEGGKAAAVDMIPGGFLGKYQIHRVHKSPVTKQVVSVSVLAPSGRFEYSWQAGRNTEPHLQKVNIQRAGEEVYREPTPEEIEAFKAIKKGMQARNKKANAGNPKLLNPTTEDAQRLQDELNRLAQESADGREKSRGYHIEIEPSPIKEMTQAEYSAKSKANGPASTKELLHGPRFGPWYSHWDGVKPPVACKLRTTYFKGNSPYRVIVITDKPQKALPSWELSEVAQEVTA
jgi:hypothetical protein